MPAEAGAAFAAPEGACKACDGRAATTLPRGMPEWRQDEFAAAGDSIVEAGSSSTTAGKACPLRSSDGHEAPSGDDLRSELKRLQAMPAPQR
jgi:hypothetical protein